MATQTDVRSPLHETVATTLTDYWNDSCSIEELTYAIANGAVGATSNPTIVGEVLHKEMHLWRDRLAEMIAERPTATEDEITWQLIEEMAVKGAELLLPIFEREHGRKGRLSIQTNPKFYRDPARITEQAIGFAGLAPNMQVKAPGTRAGIAALEEMTANGISVNATVSFTVPQALAVAEAVERGLRRREAAGEDIERDVARLHDHDRASRRLAAGSRRPARRAAHSRRRQLGGHCMREARVRDLSRARLPHAPARRRLPQPPALVAVDRRRHRADDSLQVAAPVQRVRHRGRAALRRRGAAGDPRRAQAKLPDFRRAYEPDGLTVDEFDTFGATRRTLRGFIALVSGPRGGRP